MYLDCFSRIDYLKFGKNLVSNSIIAKSCMSEALIFARIELETKILSNSRQFILLKQINALKQTQYYEISS